MGLTSTDAINKVLRTEGGFVNNPSDRGGPTNWGITQQTYSAFIGHTASIEEMKNMPKGNAILIYKKNYWDKIRGDEIKSYPVAYAIFDQYVNRGFHSIEQAQTALGIYPDGKMTTELLNRINASDSEVFLWDYLDVAESNYRLIAQNNASQVQFLAGWLNRVEDLRDYTSSFFSAVGEAKQKIIASVTENPWVYALPAVAIGGILIYYFMNQGNKRWTPA